MLEGSQFRKPTNLFVHGHVIIDGKKISKSRGTFIKVSTYLSHLHPDSLRYYYATKLSSGIDDINLNLQELLNKSNGDIVNKIVNLASRSAKFINQNFNGQLSDFLIEPTLYKTFTTASNNIAQLFHNREFNKVTKKIINLTNLANRYIDEQAPWVINQKHNNKEKTQAIYSMGIQLFRIIMIYMKPITPLLADNSERFLNTKLDWSNINKPLIQHHISPFKKLFYRITDNKINHILSESQNNSL